MPTPDSNSPCSATCRYRSSSGTPSPDPQTDVSPDPSTMNPNMHLHFQAVENHLLVNGSLDGCVQLSNTCLLKSNALLADRSHGRQQHLVQHQAGTENVRLSLNHTNHSNLWRNLIGNSAAFLLHRLSICQLLRRSVKQSTHRYR